MQEITPIIQASILGTANFPIEITDSPEGFSLDKTETTEEKILLIAAFHSLLQKSGYEPADYEGKPISLVCPPETLPYISTQAAGFVHRLMLSAKAPDTAIIRELLEKIAIINPRFVDSDDGFRAEKCKFTFVIGTNFGRKGKMDRKF